MKRVISATLFAVCLTTLFGQTVNNPNGYSNFNEYKNNTP